MTYTKIKNLDNPLMYGGKKWNFLKFTFALKPAKEFRDMYSKRYSVNCRIFTVPVKGNIVRAKTGYAVYNEY